MACLSSVSQSEVLVYSHLKRQGRYHMAIESTGHERGNPRFFALIENSPKEGSSPTI